MTRPQAPKVAIETLGCKLNQAESEQLARELREAGCLIVTPGEKADVYILNTCTVTRQADAKSRHLLRKARRRNPGGRIIATGCTAERSPENLAKISGVDLVVGNRGKGDLKGALTQTSALLPSPLETAQDCRRTRSFLKIQDGCNRRCTYCIVPFVRGGEKSVPTDQILGSIRQREAEGYLEVILTGTEIGAYRDADVDLEALLTRVLKETQIPRLRISSLQSHELTSDLLALWKNDRLCPHFHVSLQSGADSVLRRMGRGYTVKTYGESLERLRSFLPDAAVTTDIIVGFPGETKSEFEESYEFCRSAGFARIHVFPFSARGGTLAAQMPDQITDTVKRERSERMLKLAKASTTDFNLRFIGKTAKVLFERQAKGVAEGLTENYIRTHVETSEKATNTVRPVRITALAGMSVTGTLRS